MTNPKPRDPLPCYRTGVECPYRPGLAWRCARCAEGILGRELSEEEIEREELLLEVFERVAPLILEAAFGEIRRRSRWSA